MELSTGASISMSPSNEEANIRRDGHTLLYNNAANLNLPSLSMNDS